MDNDISALLDGLKIILCQLDALLESVLSIEQEKANVICQMDMKELSRLNGREQELLQKGDEYEKQRLLQIDKLAGVLNFDKSMKLNEMIKMFPEDKQKEFIKMRESINKKTGYLKEIMAENSGLINEIMDAINKNNE